MAPTELIMDLQPRARFDVIDVAARTRDQFGGVLDRYRKAFYCSYHTTAGYLEQSLCARLGYRRDRLDPFIRAVQKIFPPDAGYRHDQMELRDELTEEQKRVEPRNADSHLTFIGSGLRNCVAYTNQPRTPVYFMELDGVFEGRVRTRHTSILAYDHEEVVHTARCKVPVSRHPINSVNLADAETGLLAQINELLEQHPVDKGRVEISLDPEDRDAALTVNEYETMLMRHDLTEVLRDPLRFMAQRGRSLLRDPKAIPFKSLGYAKYDVVRVLNEIIDSLGLSESALERLLGRAMGFPARRFLRLKRSVSLPISNAEGKPAGRVVRGTYQSPILIQWHNAPGGSRTVNVTLREFA
jgi:thiamine phosphate synthase YjbQ (UPF0047 family)